jgi:hypothetical protein
MAGGLVLALILVFHIRSAFLPDHAGFESKKSAPYAILFRLRLCASVFGMLFSFLTGRAPVGIPTLATFINFDRTLRAD